MATLEKRLKCCKFSGGVTPTPIPTPTPSVGPFITKYNWDGSMEAYIYKNYYAEGTVPSVLLGVLGNVEILINGQLAEFEGSNYWLDLVPYFTVGENEISIEALDDSGYLYNVNSQIETGAKSVMGFTDIVQWGDIGLWTNPTTKATIAMTAFFINWANLKNIPQTLERKFDTCLKWNSAFYNCESLATESPYDIIDGKKVHLYDRADYPDIFSSVSGMSCFVNCLKLTDYEDIPESWR